MKYANIGEREMRAKIETQISLIHSFGSDSPNSMIVHYRSPIDFEATTCEHVRMISPQKGINPYIFVTVLPQSLNLNKGAMWSLKFKD